ncbi:MAG: hypothetical protein FWG17_01390 [Desulfovibrionaceae bacterium]|nr:hypothetical protein [Desulfovibrionaceae bacterium]
MRGVSFAFFLMALLAAPLRAAEPESLVLNLACLYPEDHPVVKEVLLPWAGEMLRQSKGRLIIRLYNPGALCQDDEVLQAVRLGQIAMGHGALSAAWTHFPLGQSTALDLGEETLARKSTAFWRIYQDLPELQKEFKGIRILALHARQPYNLYAVRDGLYGTADLRGRRILAETPAAAEALAFLGAYPLTVPLGDFSMYLNEQEADGALLTLDQAGQIQAEKEFSQAALVDLPGGMCWLGINQGLWDILPLDLRKILADASGLKLSQELGRVLRAAHRMDMDDLRAGSLRVHYLSAGERAVLRKAFQDNLLEQWQNNAQVAGMNNPRAVYERMRRIMTEAR